MEKTIFNKTRINSHLNNLKNGLFLLFFIIFHGVFAQSTTSTTKFLPIKQMPVEFRKQIAVVNGEFKYAYGMRLDSTMRDIRKYKPAQIHQFIYKVQDYEYLFRCPFWIAMDSSRYCSLIPELIKSLTDTTVVGLRNAEDVIIWCRVRTKQLKQNNFAYQIDDDVFRVCGRASWILKRLTKNEFGNIKCDVNMDELKAIQKQWQKWLNTLKTK